MSTGRASGKHRIRPAVIQPDTPEGDGIGASARMTADPSPIPGGRIHLENEATVRQRTPVPDSPPEIKDLNAHGVQPGDHTARERAEFMRGPNGIKPIRPAYDAPAVEPVPVPVRIVEARSPRVVRSSSHRKISLQASTGEPVRLCGQDANRVNILILNESSSSNVRFAQTPRDLINGGGTLLPWSSNSYIKLETQDELYAISADSGTPAVSVIQEFEQPW